MRPGEFDLWSQRYLSESPHHICLIFQLPTHYTSPWEERKDLLGIWSCRGWKVNHMPASGEGKRFRVLWSRCIVFICESISTSGCWKPILCTKTSEATKGNDHIIFIAYVIGLEIHISSGCLSRGLSNTSRFNEEISASDEGRSWWFWWWDAATLEDDVKGDKETKDETRGWFCCGSCNRLEANHFFIFT